jgi:peptidoglycan/LPS O-acetylase OafA/YrhL
MQAVDRYNNNFDFLRVFAALCICFTHSYNLLSKTNEEPLVQLSNSTIDFSFIGLSIFFTISGYLIYKSATTSSLKKYIWKRLLRIQPLLIIMCFVVVFVLGPVVTSLPLKNYFSSTQTYIYFKNIFPIFGAQFNLPGVFTSNPAEAGVNGSIWTLVIEERLYFLIGLLYVFKNYRALLFKIGVATLNIFYITHSTLFNSKLLPYFNFNAFIFMLMFLNAALLFELKIDFRKLSEKIVVWLLLATLFIFCSKYHFVTYTILTPFLVLLFAHLKTKLNNFGKNGDITYGIYLFSFPIQQLLIYYFENNLNPWMLFAYTLLITIPLAIASWHFIEKKALQLKDFVKE